MLSKRTPVFQVLILLAILPILALTACSTAVPIKAQDASTPAIKILIPRDNPGAEGITGEGLFPVVVEVTSFKLADKPGGENIPGEGHIHYFMDVEPGKSAVSAEGKYADTIETTYFWPQIGSGFHTFWAELVNNDHTPLNPPAIAKARTTAAVYWDS